MAITKNIYLGVEHEIMRHLELERLTEFPNLYETDEYWHLICGTFFVDIYIYGRAQQKTPNSKHG